MPQTKLKNQTVMLIGCPFDNGIRTMLRFGRGVTGAADGPAAIFSHLDDALSRRMLPLEPYNLPLPAADSMEFAHRQQAATEAAHALISAEIAQLCRAGRLPLAVGGDHSLTFPLLRGVAQAHPGQKPGLIYVDAHLDMRPPESFGGVTGLLSSGNSFRRLIEQGFVAGRNVAVVGVHRSESEIFGEMLDFARRHHVTVIFDDACGSAEGAARRALVAAQAGTDGVYLSVDVDAIRGSDAPGVSAPALVGLPPDWVLAFVQHVGGGCQLLGADVVEVSSRWQTWAEFLGDGQAGPESRAENQAGLQKTAALAAEIIRALVSSIPAARLGQTG